MTFKMPAKFTLRPMILSDGPAINALARRCPDGGVVSVCSVFRENAFESLENLRPQTVGVAAESPHHEGLVGMGWVSLGRCRIQEETVPYALLNTFMVHPNWRGQGVAGELSQKAIECAAARLGREGLLVADIQAGNTASRRTANRLLQAVPADGIIRENLISRFWFRRGEEAAARRLWEQARWECRHRGTSIMVFFDPRGPLARVIPRKPWSIRTSMNPVIRWERSVSPDRLVCPIL